MSDAKKTAPAQTSSVAKRAVDSVKGAPQKIVEHALNTAIDTVEKAVETDVKRAAKRAEKTAKKLEKVQKIAKAAETEAKRASKMSGSLDKVNDSEKGVKVSGAKLKGVLKEKLKDIITPQKEVSFYYDYRQLVVLTALYFLVAAFFMLVWHCLMTVGMYNNPLLCVLTTGTIAITILALISVVFVLIFPQKLAFINKDGIKIDHNEMLRWQDVDVAEEKYTSFVTRRPLIALHLKDDAIKNYRLTFMQKLCKNNVFTPFSIPMYAMRPEDAAEIRAIIKKHCKYQDNRN